MNVVLACLRAPFVCNGCPHRNHSNCRYPGRKYSAKEAQREYETVLVELREGIPLNKEEFYRNEQIISSAVKSGQNIYHAINANNLSVFKSSVYRHIARGKVIMTMHFINVDFMIGILLDNKTVA